MMTKSPSGALSPYYYKGGYFHGIHYGSYFDDMESLFSIMEKEEVFILNSLEKRRILIDIYETNLSTDMILKFVQHIERLTPKIIKLAISSDKKKLWHLRKAFSKSKILVKGQIYYSTDMEEAKTWLVSDDFNIKY